MTVPMPTVMTPELAKLLREPFKPEHMGKLPKITCGACRGSRSRPNPMKVCERHEKRKCPQCRNFITTEHMHLDYVGHAEVTDRLLAVDPLWMWEPMAFGPDGLPQCDPNGGLWIRLTVAGVTRIGYGSADGKSGGDAVKEIIGDAIRNAAMRFGVALDLWGATFKRAEDDAEAALREQAPDVPEEDWETATPVHGRGTPPAEQAPPAPHVPARPVDQGPPAAAYDRTLYPAGAARVSTIGTLVELDKFAALVERYAADGKVNAGEAGRLRMKIGARRDELSKAPPVDGPALPDAIADQALTTAN
jgi:hypothetical protein